MLNENLEEIRQLSQDALEDAILMGGDETQFRAVIADMMATLENPLREGLSMSPDIAQQLWDARQTGRPVHADRLGAISDHAAAYALQTAMTTLSGAAVVGWKLGATSAASQKALGLSGPFYGPLLAPFCFDPDAAVPGVASFGPGGEGEIAMVIGQDLAPRDAPYSEDDVAAAVAAVCPALEIAGTRLVGGVLNADPRHLIADDAANAAFIAGTPVAQWRDLDLVHQTVTLTINGTVKGQGTGADVLGSPAHRPDMVRQRMARPRPHRHRWQHHHHRHLHGLCPACVGRRPHR